MKILSIFTILLFAKSTVYSQENRVFKEDILVETQRFYPSDYDLFRPVVFAMEEDQNKYIIYDYSQHNLYSLKKDNNKILDVITIGEGRGSGPKEFRNPSDICVTNKEIIVSDTDLARISIWDIESNKLINSFKTKRFIPYRLTCHSDNIVVYNSSGSKNGNYLIYDQKGSLIKGIEDKTLSKDGFIDSGYIVADNNFIYFGSEGKPEIKKYNYLDDEAVLIKNTVQKIGNENRVDVSKSDEYITTKRNIEFKYQTRGIGLFQNHLVVFYSGRKDGHGNIIDFYDKNSLNYNFSVKLRHVFSNIDVQNDRILINAYDFERKEREFFVFKMLSE